MFAGPNPAGRVLLNSCRIINSDQGKNSSKFIRIRELWPIDCYSGGNIDTGIRGLNQASGLGIGIETLKGVASDCMEATGSTTGNGNSSRVNA